MNPSPSEKQEAEGPLSGGDGWVGITLLIKTKTLKPGCPQASSEVWPQLWHPLHRSHGWWQCQADVCWTAVQKPSCC